ncbi:MAG: GGDEF domain-containing protein, partial [bacterium]|nr:GGDEF domain-containing protein [bacterium]
AARYAGTLRGRLGEERSRSRALAEAVREVAQAAADGEAAARAALFHAVARLVPCQLLLFFRAEREDLLCTDGLGATAAAWRGVCLRRDEGENVVALAARTGRAQFSSRGRGTATQPLVPDAPRSMALAIFHRDRLCGVLYAGGLARSPNADSIELATLLGEACGGTLEAASRIERHVAEATTDGLTGLLTPRAFRARLAEELAPAARDRYAAVSLLFVDTDHFKAVNDRLGHAAGDDVLRAIARVLHQCTADAHAIVARNGGDEFCLALLDEGKGRALDRAERIRLGIAALHAGVSASIGVASFPDDASAVEQLLEAADAAMYRSKRDGRNRVSWAGQLDAQERAGRS